MKLEDCVLPVEADKFDQLTCFVVQIGDDIFIINICHATLGQGFPPVAHQILIERVIAAEFGHVVSIVHWL